MLRVSLTFYDILVMSRSMIPPSLSFMFIRMTIPDTRWYSRTSWVFVHKHRAKEPSRALESKRESLWEEERQKERERDERDIDYRLGFRYYPRALTPCHIPPVRPSYTLTLVHFSAFRWYICNIAIAKDVLWFPCSVFANEWDQSTKPRRKDTRINSLADPIKFDRGKRRRWLFFLCYIYNVDFVDEGNYVLNQCSIPVWLLSSGHLVSSSRLTLWHYLSPILFLFPSHAFNVYIARSPNHGNFPELVYQSDTIIYSVFVIFS